MAITALRAAILQGHARASHITAERWLKRSYEWTRAGDKKLADMTRSFAIFWQEDANRAYALARSAVGVQ